jgi:hypothetical protein
LPSLRPQQPGLPSASSISVPRDTFRVFFGSLHTAILKAEDCGLNGKQLLLRRHPLILRQCVSLAAPRICSAFCDYNRLLSVLSSAVRRVQRCALVRRRSSHDVFAATKRYEPLQYYSMASNGSRIQSISTFLIPVSRERAVFQAIHGNISPYVRAQELPTSVGQLPYRLDATRHLLASITGV